MTTVAQEPYSLGIDLMTVGLIGPDEPRRKALATAISEFQPGSTREFSSYPDVDDVSRLLESDFDVIVLELDSNPEKALDLVEQICGSSQATVMVYSSRSDSDLLVRCMRAGAREFLTQPVAAPTLAQAFVRASARRPRTRAPRKAMGRLLVFTGAKGGTGVTTIAGNFAVALAKATGQNTLLIDLGIPLGDAALDLGINAQFSTANALEEFNRLDSNFLSKLLTKHRSGLSVLAAPDKYTAIHPSDEAVDRLMSVARQGFDFVVVDAGSSIGPTCTTLFEAASVVYLVTQVSVSELRNSNRLIAGLFAASRSKLEIVLNRYSPRSVGIDDENINKALTEPAKWKIPSDYIAVKQSQNTASPLVLGDSPISRVIRQMARAAAGLAPAEDKKKRFGLF